MNSLLKKDNIFRLFRNLFLHIILVIISVILIYSIDYFIVKTLEYPSISELFRKSKKNIDKWGLFKIIILAPIIEEIIFRLLLKPNAYKVYIFSFIMSFFILHGSFFSIELDYKFLKSIIISCLIIFLLYYFNIGNILSVIIKKNINLFIFISISIFGIIHIFNIDKLYWELALFYPIYVLPQFLLGYFITDLRIKSGFIWGILFHSIINLIGSSI